MLGRLGWSLARFVGLVFVLLGGWVFLINVVELSYSGGILIWIVLSGLFGAVGGVAYLLSIDGPERFRSRKVRSLGWFGMAALAILPTSVSLILIPMLVLTLPTLFIRGHLADGQPVAN